MSLKTGKPFDTTLLKEMERVNRQPNNFMEGIKRQARWVVADQIEEMQKALIEFGKKGHANVVLLTTAKMDEQLKALLMTRMPAITGRLEKKIFDYALASFEVKVNIVRAMALIDEDLAHQLGIIGAIRNAFAHSSTELNFDHPSIVKQTGQFRGKVEGEQAYRTYARITKDCAIELAELLKAEEPIISEEANPSSS